MKICILSVFTLLVGISFTSFAQRGKITKPTIGNPTSIVMDPNQDRYVSKTTAGFSNDGYYVDEFEIPMFGIPIIGDGEVLNDNQAGANCGTTDLTVDSQGFSVYGVLDGNGNLIFRFRIGDDKPSVEAYTILIDTDGKIGPDDLNATTNNPGFEIDITLIKNSGKGVFVYNIDGIESCPTPEFNYPFASNFQISIADIVSCSDPDYFYDFFVPFNDIKTRFGVSGLTEMRFVAVTNVSATCAMAGKISDVGGVDDTVYGGCNTCAFLDLVNNQCPTAIEDLCPTCQGFLTGVTPKPTINTPLKVGEFIATGTTVANADIFVDVYNFARVLKDQKTSVANASGDWIVNLTVALQLGDSVTAKARAPGLCSSGSLSSGASFTIVTLNQPPVLSGSAGVLTYNENDPPLRINGTLAITDVDDTDLDGATIIISVNYISGQDVLTFTAVPGISGVFNPGSGSIVFSGSATITDYQTLLRSVHYRNTSENPSTLQRTVTMVVNDGLDNSNIFSRLINVVSVNDAPVAVNDTGATNEDTPVTLLNITANDTDVDGTVNAATVDLDLGVVGIQNSFSNAQGSWSVNGAGDVNYTPALNFNGIAIISYTVQDNQGAISSQANITITVNPVNDAPVANDDSGITYEVTPITIGATNNDTDIDGTVNPATVDLDPITPLIQNIFVTADGSWSVDTNGNVTFVPALGFSGTSLIAYTVQDNNGATSAPANISIVVSGIDPGGLPPTAIDDNGTTNEDTPVTLNVTNNDIENSNSIDISTVDLNLNLAGIQNTLTNSHGDWSVSPFGDITYQPLLNLSGVGAIIQYTVQDIIGRTSNVGTVTITVIPINDAPEANDDIATTNEDTPITLINITTNDTDIDGTVDAATVDIDPLTAGIQNTLTNAFGNWLVNGSGDVTYMPILNFNGVAIISYVVNDDLGGLSNASLISITVDPVNDAPLLVDVLFSTLEDVPLTASVFDVADADLEGTTMSVDTSPVLAPSNGEIVINVDGTFTYTPDPLFSGQDVVQVSICDAGVPLPSACATKLLTITVIPVNHKPETFINGQPGGVLIVTTDEDMPIVACFESIDPDGDDVFLSSITNIEGGGSLTLYDNIEFCLEFIPEKDFNGTVKWEIIVCDDGNPSLCGTVILEINVLPVNDPPTAVRDSINVLRNVVSFGNVLDNDFDVEGDQMIVRGTPIVMPSHGVALLNSDGSFSYQSDRTFRGIDSLIYQVCDVVDPPACSQGTLVIVVGDVPLRPYEGLTPNGDGNNDYWRIEGIDFYTENKVRIFDRFNNLVFEMFGYDNENKIWRGEANHGLVTGDLPEATYFYNIDLGDGSAPVSGFIVLKRK